MPMSVLFMQLMLGGMALERCSLPVLNPVPADPWIPEAHMVVLHCLFHEVFVAVTFSGLADARQK